MEVTGTVNAYVSPHSSLSPTDLEKESAIPQLTFAKPRGDSDYFIQSGYTLVGTAAITVTLLDKHTLVSNKIDALRNEAVTIRAEATKKCTHIESQIQNLLCLENDAPIAVKPYDDGIPF